MYLTSLNTGRRRTYALYNNILWQVYTKSQNAFVIILMHLKTFPCFHLKEEQTRMSINPLYAVVLQFHKNDCEMMNVTLDKSL